MKHLKRFNESNKEEYYQISDLETYLKSYKKKMSKSTIESLVSFLKERGFIKLKKSPEASTRLTDENFQNNTYDIVLFDYTQILIRTKYNFSLIKITEDNDEWFYVSVTDWSLTTYYKADQIDGLLLMLEYLLERFI